MTAGASDESSPIQGRPLRPWYRWLVLAAISFVCFAQYYIYDAITPLGTTLKAELHFSGAEYGLLFSAYSVANVFLLMLLIAGVLVDKLGLKLSGILYAGLCVVGAALTALGAMRQLPEILGPAYGWLGQAFPAAWSPELKIMLLGRTLYGVGAEAILVVNNKVLARWFLGKELAFAYGINLTVMRLGTFLALNLEAPVAKAWGLRTALWFAVIIMLLGFIVFFGYLALERGARGRRGAPATTAAAPEEKFRLRQAFSFSPSFWFITLLCLAFYSAVFPFQSYAPDILVNKFGYDEVRAGAITSALILGTMIFTPIFGFLVDKRGRRATLMILGALLLVPCHLVIAWTRVPPIIPIFVVGISLSLVPAALWAAIPMMVPENRLGTAFGVIGYLQNVGLMVFPFLAGKIADAHTIVTTVAGKEVKTVDYTATLTLFAGLGALGIIFAVALKIADRRRKQGPSIEAALHG